MEKKNNNTVTEMKSIFNEYTDTFNVAKERISELKGKKVQTS